MRSLATPRIIAFLVLLLIASGTVGARGQARRPAHKGRAQQSGPSLGETLAWLKGFVPRATGETFHGAGGATHTVTNSMETEGGCRIVLTRTDRHKESHRDSETKDKQEISLGDIDPSAVRVWVDDFGLKRAPRKEINVVLGVRGDANLVVDFRDYTATLFGRTTASRVELHFDSASALAFVDRQSAERVVKAFRHAAELCAKSEPF